MDPLSIIASVIAIGSFTTASSEVILVIRGASDEVQALINEMSDLSAIIKDVEYTLRYNKRLNAESTDVASLHAVLSKANTTVNHLHSSVCNVLIKEETLLRDARISRTVWLREKSQVSKYQRQLVAIKLELSHALGIANLSTGARIELSVANVIALSDHTRNLIQAQLTETHRLRGEVRDLRQIVDFISKGDVKVEPPSNSQQSNLLPLHLKDSNKRADVSLEGRRGLEGQVVWRPSWACDSSCHCLCHETKHGRSPRSLDRLLGILFCGYCGVPIVRKRCDVVSCRRRRGLRFGMSYYFPAWFVEKRIELTFHSMLLGGPQISIKVASIVSNGALLFKYTHNKDILGIQSLFSQGLAAPSDAGHLDGFPALHACNALLDPLRPWPDTDEYFLKFAVTRGSIEVIDFLIKSTDADRYALNSNLESPSSYAWDIILGNSMDKEAIDFLRATFSDRDFLQEQNFNLAHEIVLGLNGRKLGEALKERPHLTDSPDNRGDTPLIWAASRGDIEVVHELLKHEASSDFRNNNGCNALYSAVDNARLDCTALLLSSGYTDHKDYDGMTALHSAPTYVQLLLQHDLNVNEQDVFQRCPLALAAWRNNALVVAYLLDRGADREMRDIFGATPLLRAIQYAAVDASKLLLEIKCDMLAVDHESKTVLHRAALSRDVATINLLTEKKYTLQAIDVNAKDNSGKTAKERLHVVEPSAELLVAFTALIGSIENDEKTVQAEEALARNVGKDQDVFKDAIEFQKDGSASSSCHTTDNERAFTAARRKGRARLTQPLNRISRKWASKYRDTFRSFDRYLDSASSSTARLNNSWPKG